MNGFEGVASFGADVEVGVGLIVLTAIEEHTEVSHVETSVKLKQTL